MYKGNFYNRKQTFATLMMVAEDYTSDQNNYSNKKTDFSHKYISNTIKDFYE